MMRKMKDSGLVWIGQIPADWQINKIKFTIESGENGLRIGPFGSALKGLTLSEGPVKIYNQANLIAENFDISKHYISAETYEKLKSYTINAGDILFSMMGTIGKCRIMPKGKPIGIMDSHLLKGRLNTNKVLPEFFVYAFDKDRNPATLEQLIYSSQGSIMNGLNSSIVKNIKLAIPNKNEQQQIVSYLDAKCDAIDKAIAHKRSVIEKLKEYRTAVITKAVTKGLNPDTEMKDSGNDIIGFVPKDWKCKRMKFIVDVVRGGSPRPIEQYLSDKGYNWIKIGDATNNGKYINNTQQKIIPDGLSKTRFVKKNTLLLTNSMSFGHPYFLNIDGCIHDGWLAFLNYKDVTKEFLYYVLISNTSMAQFSTSVEGSVVVNLNIQKVRNSFVALPTIPEQQQITSYLDDKCNKIDIAIHQQEQIIAKLEEYRKSVIYYAVTGKKEVSA